LAEVAANALRIMNNTLQEAEVHVTTEMDSSLIVLGDRNHIIQILINLIQNAIDAMQGRPKPSISLRVEQAHENIRLTLRDNGTGIPHENLPKVFDPFFTTKEVGAGMGMGLSICFRLMQQMGGRIEASSHPGHWTEFVLSFPQPYPEANLVGTGVPSVLPTQTL
jgi:two-component system sensor histidine kinase PhcS